MPDYKPNSHKYREGQNGSSDEKRKVEKIVKGTVRTKKKSELSKFASSMISDEAKNVGSYIVGDVLIPTICKTIVDIISDSVNMIFLGKTGAHRDSNYRSSNAHYVSYRSYSDSKDDRRYESSRSLSGYSYDDIVFDSRRDAEEVLIAMGDLLDAYNVVRVADLYDLVGKTGRYTDNDYGWTNLAGADVQRVRDGWLLKLPRATAIR